MEDPNLYKYAIPILFIAMVVEYYAGREDHKPVYSRKDFLSNLALGLIGTLTGLLGSYLALRVYQLCFDFFAPFREVIFKVSSWSWNWKVWVVAMLLGDFTFYWFHRIHHRVRILWAAHVVHHSSEYFNYSISMRFAWVSNIHKPLFWAWMAALGFHPVMIAMCLTINSIYQGFTHTKYSKYWDKLSFFLNTPGLHAIHHGKNDFCIDKNYSGMFIIFDKIFGTYEPIQKDITIEFGVTHPPKSGSLIEISIHEFRDIWKAVSAERKLKNKWNLLFKPPGWKPPINSSPN
ncbi:MAG TPA: sterol desaturase family protein [Saprospiraceae bacterium]|nr:sterol desaturase family protein [Saprospiraceae bacterium]